MSDIYDWSLTADKNAHSDSMINGAEGHPPRSVCSDGQQKMQQR
ncbi:hypothetical protein [Bartonella saheliensis]